MMVVVLVGWQWLLCDSGGNKGLGVVCLNWLCCCGWSGLIGCWVAEWLKRSGRLG